MNKPRGAKTPRIPMIARVPVPEYFEDTTTTTTTSCSNEAPEKVEEPLHTELFGDCTFTSSLASTSKSPIASPSLSASTSRNIESPIKIVVTSPSDSPSVAVESVWRDSITLARRSISISENEEESEQAVVEMESEFRRVEDALSQIGYIATPPRSAKEGGGRGEKEREKEPHSPSHIHHAKKARLSLILRPSPARKPIITASQAEIDGVPSSVDGQHVGVPDTPEVVSKRSSATIVYGGIDYESYTHFLRALDANRRDQADQDFITADDKSIISTSSTPSKKKTRKLSRLSGLVKKFIPSPSPSFRHHQSKSFIPTSTSHTFSLLSSSSHTASILHRHTKHKNKNSLSPSLSSSSFETQGSGASIKSGKASSSRWSYLRDHAKDVRSLLSRKSNRSSKVSVSSSKSDVQVHDGRDRPSCSAGKDGDDGRIEESNIIREEEENPFLDSTFVPSLATSGSDSPMDQVQSLTVTDTAAEAVTEAGAKNEDKGKDGGGSKPGKNLLKKLVKAKLNLKPLPKSRKSSRIQQHKQRLSTDDNDGQISSSSSRLSNLSSFFSKKASSSPSLTSTPESPSRSSPGSNSASAVSITMTTSTQATPDLTNSTSTSGISLLTDSDLSEEDYWLQLNERSTELTESTEFQSDGDLTGQGRYTSTRLPDQQTTSKSKTVIFPGSDILVSSSTISIGVLISAASSVILNETPPSTLIASSSSLLYGLSFLATSSCNIIRLLAEARYWNQSLIKEKAIYL